MLIQLFGLGNTLASTLLNLCTPFLYFGGIHTLSSHSISTLKIPLKHKLFLWLALYNKFLTKENLRKRGWSGDISCVFCTLSHSENVNHFFFQCPFITPLWRKIVAHHPHGHLLNTSSLISFWTSCLVLPDFKFWGTLLVANLWIIWLQRNQRVFSSSSIPRAATIYFLILQLFKFWTGSSTNLDRVLVVEMDPAVVSAAPPADLVIGAGEGSTRAEGDSSLLVADEDLLDY
jgi:zinc-binding in reverse transcriptase